MGSQGDNVNHSAGQPTDVLDVVHRLMHDYRTLQYRALRDGEHGVTHLEAKVLGFFSQHPGATQSELVQSNGRDKAQMARLLKGLRDRALLTAEVDEGDRRNVRLTLSPDGQAVQRALKQQARRLGAKAVTGLTEREQQQLLALLQRVRGNLSGL